MEICTKVSKGNTQSLLNKNSNPFDSFYLFLAGHFYDPDNSYRELPKDIIYVISSFARMEFVYKSDFDQQGVFFWLSTTTSQRINKEKIINLGPNDTIMATWVNNEGKCLRIAHPKDSLCILGKRLNETQLLSHKSQNCFIIDLQKFRLRVKRITFCCSYTPRRHDSWDIRFQLRIFGSHNLTSWKEIDPEPQTLDKELLNQEKTLTLSFPKCDYYYRYFKLRYSTQSVYYFGSSGLEMYGSLI
jgi:hypothetical protein